ncbi:MAG: histidine kinase [Arcobacter sp.]|nr:MAG: histidine kinase [Arcobacter sp.]
MYSKNVNIIFKIIKFGPPILIIFLSIILSFSLYLNNQSVFNADKKLIENEHIQRNKILLKSQVESVYSYIIKKQADTENKLKKLLKERVNEAYNIAINIYNENKHLDKIVVTKMIKDALRKLRFNNDRGYIFIYSFDYECILFPPNKNVEGDNFYNYKEGKGNYLARDIIGQVKKEKEGFMNWWFPKPSEINGKQHKKIGFNKHFEPYNWFIGTGEYVEDFENDLKKEVLDYIHNLSFPNNEYIFVVDFEGKYLNHIRDEIIGKNALEVKDVSNQEIISNAINVSKNNKGGFITYVHNRKPGSDLPTIKTSYIKGFEKWNFFIGKGFYEDDINNRILQQKEILDKKFQNSLNNIIITSLVLTFILLFISIKISKILQNKFEDYQKEIEKNLEKITKQQSILAQQTKVAALGNMIGNIAHQWRQPLSLISTAATGMQLKKELGSLDDDEFYDTLDQINNSTQYLSKTIDDFRNFFASNKEKEDFKISEALKKTINLTSAQFQNHDIHINNNIGDSIIYGIESELVQVLINILNNARDELLKKEKQDRIILIDSKEENDSVTISIRDNAGGIPQETLEHVFEPYFTTKHKSQGTGIGLYMSREIILKHFDGSITMENCEFEYEKINYKGVKINLTFELVN